MASAGASAEFSCYYTGCTKTFVSKFNLRRHINVSHLEIRQHACPVCGKRLASKQNVKEHLYTHTGEKPFQCLVPGCGKNFRQASHLSFHKKTHLRPSLIQRCEATSSSLNLLSLLGGVIAEDTLLIFSKKTGSEQVLPPLTLFSTPSEWKLPIASGLLDPVRTKLTQ